MLRFFFSSRLLPAVGVRRGTGRRRAAAARPFSAEQLEGRLMLASAAGTTYEKPAIPHGATHESAMLLGGARSHVAPLHVAGARSGPACTTPYTWQTVDQGTTFTSQNWQRVAMSDDGRRQTAVTRGGNIYTSNDSGKSWQPCSQNFALNWEGIAMTSSGERQTAVAEGDLIYTSRDYGKTWQQSSAPVADWIYVSMSETGRYQTAVANGLFNSELTNGYIYRSEDFGRTWTAVTSQSNSWIAVAMSANGRIQTAVSLYIYDTPDPDNVQGYVYNSTDFGKTWTKNTSLPKGYYTSVAMSGSGAVQIVGESNCNYSPAPPGNIFISRNGGSDFAATTAQKQNWLNLFVSADGKDMWAASYQQPTDEGGVVPNTGLVLASSDGGRRWVDSGLPNSTWTSVYASRQSDHVTCVAWGNGISILKNGNRDSRSDARAISGSALVSAAAFAGAAGGAASSDTSPRGKVRLPGTAG